MAEASLHGTYVPRCRGNDRPVRMTLVRTRVAPQKKQERGTFEHGDDMLLQITYLYTLREFPKKRIGSQERLTCAIDGLHGLDGLEQPSWEHLAARRVSGSHPFVGLPKTLRLSEPASFEAQDTVLLTAAEVAACRRLRQGALSRGGSLQVGDLGARRDSCKHAGVSRTPCFWQGEQLSNIGNGF